ncbi:hypothetical protein BH23PLA1_BH23PLA1_19040 [soil metagenome]
MNYLHYSVDLGPGDVVKVDLDREANVLLLDEANYQGYRSGRNYRYYGGLAKTSPIRLSPPGPGRYHVVVDLGGYPGSVKAGVTVERAAVEVG